MLMVVFNPMAIIKMAEKSALSLRSMEVDPSQLDILVENAKPVLMNIIENEIYEEGDLSYDY